MAYVITQKCQDEQYGQCVDVCPVDCIHPVEHEGKPFMVIDPDVCIDCGLCLPECPIGAIVSSPQEAPTDARLDADLTPAAKAWEQEHGKVMGRQPLDPPHRPDNRLVHGTA